MNYIDIFFQEEELKEEYLINYEESIKEMEIELQNMENKIDELKNLTLVINTQVYIIYICFK